MRSKIAGIRADLDRNYAERRILTERLNELQGECTHEEGYKASNRFDGLEFCEICGSPRVKGWR